MNSVHEFFKMNQIRTKVPIHYYFFAIGSDLKINNYLLPVSEIVVSRCSTSIYRTLKADI